MRRLPLLALVIALYPVGNASGQTTIVPEISRRDFLTAAPSNGTVAKPAPSNSASDHVGFDTQGNAVHRNIRALSNGQILETYEVEGRR